MRDIDKAHKAARMETIRVLKEQAKYNGRLEQYYLSVGSPDVAKCFTIAVESCLREIRRHQGREP